MLALSSPMGPVGLRSAPCSAPFAVTPEPRYVYEPLERFGEGLTSRRPWNTQALAGVEQLNGRVAMLGFLAAVLGEATTGRGVVGQLQAILSWLLSGSLA